MTQPRRIVPDETYLITRRCTRREYLLRPDEETKAIFDYCIAEAAARFEIKLLAWEMMANHYHAVAHDPHGRIPAFLAHFHKMMAKVMNARWGRSENFWSSEETCLTRLVSPQDILDKIVYVLCNPVAADLVEYAHEWPGSSSLEYLDGRVTEHRRPKHYFRDADSVMNDVVTLRMQLPRRITKHESAESFIARVRAGVARREQELRSKRIEEKRRVLGRKAAMRVKHTDSPKTEAKKEKGKLRPHLACKEKQRRMLELRALKEWREAYAEARREWVRGNRRVVFPYGTYQMLHGHSVCCAKPTSLPPS